MSAPKVRRCPQCGAKPVSYQEVWSGTLIEFDADDTGRPEKEGTLIPDAGAPAYVIAVCAADHGWRLRGVTQISELRANEDEAAA